jgi:hypothetical protein
MAVARRGIVVGLICGALTAACAVSRGPKVTPAQQASERLDRADALARAGQYTDAREGYLTVLAEPREPAASDRALLGLARLALDPENPTKDQRQAAAYLDRLLAESPHSGWATEARTWRELLASIDRLQREMRRNRQDFERLRRELQHEQHETARLRHEREQLRQIDVQYERPIQMAPTAAQSPAAPPNTKAQ